MPRIVKNLRKIEVVGATAFVPLTQGFVAEIDVDDIALVSAFNWRATFSRRDAPYGITWLSQKGGRKISVLLHRYILGAAAGVLVDHVDGNPLNNRRSNLRAATHSQNNQNKRAGIRNRSGFKGVHWCNTRQYWVARIGIDGRRIVLGQFNSAEEAGAAYAVAALREFGSFARIE